MNLHNGYWTPRCFLLQLGVDQGTAGQAVVMMKVGWSAIEF